MDFKKHLGFSLTIGILAGLWYFAALKLQITAWTAFVGWSIYFFNGANLEGAKNSFPCIILGALLGYVTVLGIGLMDSNSAAFTLLASLAVFVLAFVMTYAPTIPLFSVVPAIFVSCAAFFGSLGARTPIESLFDVVVFTSFGLILGIISTKMVTLFEKPTE